MPVSDIDDTLRHAPENDGFGGCVGDSGGVPVGDLVSPVPDGAAQPVDLWWHGGVLEVLGELVDGGDALDLIDELGTHLYKDGFAPLARAHLHAAVPLRRGTEILASIFSDR